MLRGFARRSLHSGDALAPEALSPESVVTLCPLVGWRHTREPGPFPKLVGMQNRGLGWGWGLPAWLWALARAGSAWAALGDPQGCIETRQRAVHTPGRGSCPPGWFWEGFLLCLPHPSAAALLQRGLCPPVLCLPRWRGKARSVPSVPGRGTVSPVPRPFPSSRPLQRALLASCLRAAPQPWAEAEPAQPSPGASAVCVSRVGVPVMSVVCRWC